MRRGEGITLISLVVTIIILIILAGVSIALVLGDNGLVTKAKLAKQNTIIAQEEENRALDNYDKEIEEALNDSLSSIIERFTPVVEENNGITVKISANVTETNEEDIASYIYLLNGEVIDETEKSNYTYQNLQMNTNYTIAVVAKDKEGNTRKSSELKVKTNDKVYLYKDGNEYGDITGGWKYTGYHNRTGTFNKTDTTLELSAGTDERVYVGTEKMIDFSNDTKLYIKYSGVGQVQPSTMDYYNNSYDDTYKDYLDEGSGIMVDCINISSWGNLFLHFTTVNGNNFSIQEIWVE